MLSVRNPLDITKVHTLKQLGLHEWNDITELTERKLSSGCHRKCHTAMHTITSVTYAKDHSAKWAGMLLSKIGSDKDS